MFEFDIPTISAVTIDNGANMVAGIRIFVEGIDLEEGIDITTEITECIRCAGHILNLVMQKAFKLVHMSLVAYFIFTSLLLSISVIGANMCIYIYLSLFKTRFTVLLDKVKVLVIFIRDHNVYKLEFQRACSELGITNTYLKLNVATRWNSNLDMIERFLEVYDAIKKYE